MPFTPIKPRRIPAFKRNDARNAPANATANSLPAAEMPRSTDYRLCAIHKNVPNVLNQITARFTDTNISNFTNRSRGEIAYTILDLDSEIPEEALEAIRGIEGVIRVRTL